MVDSKSVSDEKLGLKNNDDILKDFGVSPLRKSTGWLYVASDQTHQFFQKKTRHEKSRFCQACA